MSSKPPIQPNTPPSNPSGDYIPIADVQHSPFQGGNPKPGPPNNKGGRFAAIFMVVGLVLVLIAVGLGVLLYNVVSKTREAARRVEQENRQERRENIKQAFGGDQDLGAVDLPIDKQEIESVFADLKTACDIQSRVKFKQVFDVKEMLNCVEDQCDFDMPRNFNWPAFKEGAAGSFDTNFAEMTNQFAHDACQIKMIQPLNIDGRVLVYARLHHYEVGSSVKARFWLYRDQGRVKIYDFEEIESGHRITAALVNFLRTEVNANLTMAKAQKLRTNSQRLLQVRDHILQTDYESANRILDLMKYNELIKPQQSIYLILKATVELHTENYAAAVEASDKLKRINSDAIIYLLLGAAAHNGLGNYEESISHAEQFQELVGPDSDALYWIAMSKAGLGQPTEAIELFRKSLDDNPNNFESLFELAMRLEEPDTELKTRFEQIVNKEYSFDILANAFEVHYRPELIKPLLDAYKSGQTSNWQYAYYAALLAETDAEKTSASQLIKPWLRRKDEIGESFTALCEQYALVNQKQKSIAEMYRDIPDPLIALYAIGSAFYDEAKPLFELTDLYEADRSKDSEWLYYRAQAFISEESFEDCFKLLNSRYADFISLEDSDLYFELYYDSATRSGNTLAAYKTCIDKDSAFDNLISSLDIDSDEFMQLVSEHETNNADDVNLAYHKARRLEHQGKYSEAFETLSAAAPRFNQDQWFYYHSALFAKCAIKSNRLLNAYENAPNKENLLVALQNVDIPQDQIADFETVVRKHQDEFGHSITILNADLHLAIESANWVRAFELRKTINEHEEYDDYDPLWNIVPKMGESDAWKQAIELSQNDKDVIDFYAIDAIRKCKSERLAELIDVVRNQDLPESEVELWKICSMVDTGEYQEALTRLEQFKKNLASLETTQYPKWYCVFLVECLAHTGQFDQAITKIGELAEMQHDSPNAIAVEMARGDKQAASKEFENWTTEWYTDIDELSEHRVIKSVLKLDAAKQVFAHLKEQVAQSNEQN